MQTMTLQAVSYWSLATWQVLFRVSCMYLLAWFDSHNNPVRFVIPHSIKPTLGSVCQKHTTSLLQGWNKNSRFSYSKSCSLNYFSMLPRLFSRQRGHLLSQLSPSNVTLASLVWKMRIMSSPINIRFKILNCKEDLCPFYSVLNSFSPLVVAPLQLPS